VSKTTTYYKSDHENIMRIYKDFQKYLALASPELVEGACPERLW
jgi:hypothetical protein